MGCKFQKPGVVSEAMIRGITFVLALTGVCWAEVLEIRVGVGKETATPAAAAVKLAELRKAEPGKSVVVILDGGRYELAETLSLNAGHSGSSGATVVWRSAEGEAAEISGARRIGGFAAGSDGLWRLKLPEGLEFSQLWVNGKRAVRARHPNAGTISLKSAVEEKSGDKAKARQTVKLDAAAMEAFRGTGKTEGLQVLVYHKWDNTRRGIDTMDAAGGVFSTVGKEMKSWNVWNAESGVVFENAKALLDAPGEWFAAGGELFYKPRPGENAATAYAEVPVLERLLEIKGETGKKAGGMEWNGITFSGTGWGGKGKDFDAEQAAASIGAAIEISAADGIVFRNCKVVRTANYGIWFRKGCAGGVVEKTLLTDLGAGGLRAGEKEMPQETEESGGHRFENNIIRDGGHVFPCAVAVWIGQSADNVVIHNEISHFPYTGVSVGWRWGYAESAAKRNRIHFNHIHHIGDGQLSDMGAVYTLGPSEGTSVNHNRIHDIISKTYGGWGLYTDEGSTGIVMEKNLVTGTKSGGFHQHYGKENIIRNNIFAFSKKQQVQFTRVEEHVSFEFTRNIILWDDGELLNGNGWGKGKLRMNHNLFWKTDGSEPLFIGKSLPQWREGTGRDKDSIVADPGFADAKRGDWAIGNAEAIRQIGFEAFDPMQAGVTGDEAWKNLAAEK